MVSRRCYFEVLKFCIYSSLKLEIIHTNTIHQFIIYRWWEGISSKLNHSIMCKTYNIIHPLWWQSHRNLSCTNMQSKHLLHMVRPYTQSWAYRVRQMLCTSFVWWCWGSVERTSSPPRSYPRLATIRPYLGSLFWVTFSFYRFSPWLSIWAHQILGLEQPCTPQAYWPSFVWNTSNHSCPPSSSTPWNTRSTLCITMPSHRLLLSNLDTERCAQVWRQVSRNQVDFRYPLTVKLCAKIKLLIIALITFLVCLVSHPSLSQLDWLRCVAWQSTMTIIISLK